MAARDHDVVVCEGEWDIARAGEFARRVAHGLDGPGVLILDFGPATFVDATTAGAILRLSHEAPARGNTLAVACGEGIVRRLFTLVHLPEIVPVAASVEEALRAARALRAT